MHNLIINGQEIESNQNRNILLVSNYCSNFGEHNCNEKPLAIVTRAVRYAQVKISSAYVQTKPDCLPCPTRQGCRLPGFPPMFTLRVC